MVADCPYDGVMGLFSYYFRRRLRVPAGLPAALAFPGLACALGFAFTRSTCGGEAASCALPLLLIEAGEDTTVPPGSAGSILAARGGNTALVRFERAPHALCWQEDREKYAKALLDFGFGRWLAPFEGIWSSPPGKAGGLLFAARRGRQKGRAGRGLFVIRLENRDDGAIVAALDELAAGLAGQGLDKGLDLGAVLLAGAAGDYVGVGLGGVALRVLAGEGVVAGQAGLEGVVAVDDAEGHVGQGVRMFSAFISRISRFSGLSTMSSTVATELALTPSVRVI